ncbi:MAG: PAS domain S-box protein [Bryobacterales bacterium]|nr:PAS domain S-box protein [Bryobacterales bacterium]MBV9398780.1 PAS domain S-box protein [Bryobacterales bacterium]
MFSLEWIWEPRNRARVLVASAIFILIVAFVDWRTEPYFSLGFLYLFPIMLAAAFLPRWMVALLGIACAGLSEVFSSLDRSVVRLIFEALALSGCGLFFAELSRNRRLNIEMQQQLKALVETSPAAIVTVNEKGYIELANRAAGELMAPHDRLLVGNPVAMYLPELHHALRRREETPQFRASMQCRGHRDNGESFMADVWFSTYQQGPNPKLAAIIADVTEDTAQANGQPADHDRSPLTDREMDVFRYLVQGMANKEIAAKMEISESAVKNTLQQLFAKTNVRTRAQLVRVALEQYRDLL